MSNISSSSLSFAAIEGDSTPKAFATKSKITTTPSGITAVHHSANILASLRSRLNLTLSCANQQKASVLKNVEPVHQTENFSTNNKTLDAIFEDFAQQLATIETKSVADIQAVENRANALQAQGMRRGMGMAVSHGVEADKKRAISDLKKTATHERNILFLRAKQELLAYQKSYFDSVFEIYANQLPTPPAGTLTQGNLDQPHQIVTQAFEEEQKLIESLFALEQTSKSTPSTIAAVIKVITLADTVRLQALHPFVERSINIALDNIEETHQFLHQLSQVKGNPFLTTKALATFHEELDQRHANYLLAESLFDGTAKDIALNNAVYLQTKIDETSSEIARASQENGRTTLSDQVLLKLKISLLTNLLSALEKAHQAYERIADNASLKIKTQPLLPKDSTAFSLISDSASSSSLTIDKACQALLELAAQTTIRRRTIGLNILSQLSDFLETENNHAVLGRRGEIELADGTSSSFTSNTKVAQEGINLVRLAVFRDFGSRGLERFDMHFHDKMVALNSPEAQNCLTVGELKNFIQIESSINPSAFYLSSAHSMTELLCAESNPFEDSKSIKSDGISFNPFSKTALTAPPLTEDQERARSLTAIRTALKEFFKELPGELRQPILNRFDEKFKPAPNKTLLTVAELRSFITTEIENLNSLNFNLAGPFFYSLGWHLATASLWTIMMSVHPPAWMIMGISLSIGVGHDLTSYWRQLRPEEER